MRRFCMHGHDTALVGRTRRGMCAQCKREQNSRSWYKAHPRKLSNPRFHRIGQCRIPDCDLCFDVLMVTMP